jgi:hypothetical protein
VVGRSGGGSCSFPCSYDPTAIDRRAAASWSFTSCIRGGWIQPGKRGVLCDPRREADSMIGAHLLSPCAGNHSLPPPARYRVAYMEHYLWPPRP